MIGVKIRSYKDTAPRRFFMQLAIEYNAHIETVFNDTLQAYFEVADWNDPVFVRIEKHKLYLDTYDVE